MKIAVLFDGASALGASADVLILETVEAVERVLREDGSKVVRIAVYDDARWVERLRRAKVDLVFNLCEGIDGIATLEPAVLAVLELFGLPYTGNSSYTTALCLRKHVVNALIASAGLPVPRWGVVRRGGPLPTVGFPAICKPAAEDASIGIEQRSVVRSMRALTARVDAMHERWDEVVVQHFVEGREINVGILGARTLPLAEVDFGAMPKGLWRIVSYRSKWERGSDEDEGASPRCPAELPAELEAEISEMALSAWALVGGAGYGRVDFRIDRTGRPWLLEVNSNPDLAPDAGLARMAAVAGIDYAALVRSLCEQALATPTVPPAEHWAMARRLSGVAATDDGPALDLLTMGRR